MDEQRVGAAYAGRAQEYIAAFGSVASQDPEDVERILTWALGIDGPVLDVGCGPGVLTGRLAAGGVDAAGLDLAVRAPGGRRAPLAAGPDDATTEQARWTRTAAGRRPHAALLATRA